MKKRYFGSKIEIVVYFWSGDPPKNYQDYHNGHKNSTFLRIKSREKSRKNRGSTKFGLKIGPKLGKLHEAHAHNYSWWVWFFSWHKNVEACCIIFCVHPATSCKMSGREGVRSCTNCNCELMPRFKFCPECSHKVQDQGQFVVSSVYTWWLYMAMGSSYTFHGLQWVNCWAEEISNYLHVFTSWLKFPQEIGKAITVWVIGPIHTQDWSRK